MEAQPKEFCPHGGMVEPAEASPATLAARAEGHSNRRLSIAALVASLLWGLGALHQAWNGQLDAVLGGTTLAVLAASAALLVVSRMTSEPSKLMPAGSLYLLGTSFAVAAVEQHTGAGAGISWNALWVGFFPLMVPCSPRRTLVKALVAATATPIVLGLFLVFGHRPVPPLTDVAALLVPVYLGAGIAYMGARFIARLGVRMSAMESVGRYNLIRQLGEGGMGEVYEARHRLLARPVALKLIKQSGDKTALARFEREARVTASLKSAHTIELYDFGATEDGRIFYAMELLEGMDLEALVSAHGPLPPARVAHVLKQALHSLEEAHARGLVHRDIKPANLHLGRYGLTYDHLKVLDFGLVKSSGDLELGASLTADGRISGTPGYMAPESVTGDGTIDGRADVYALACVAIYLLTGQRVFPDVQNVLGAAVAHVTETPRPPSERGVEVPAELEAIIMACLEKDPVRRPDAATLRAQLEACELEPWDGEDARSWWEQNAALPPARITPVPGGASAPGGSAPGISSTQLAMPRFAMGHA